LSIGSFVTQKEAKILLDFISQKTLLTALSRIFSVPAVEEEEWNVGPSIQNFPFGVEYLEILHAV